MVSGRDGRRAVQDRAGPTELFMMLKCCVMGCRDGDLGATTTCTLPKAMLQIIPCSPFYNVLDFPLALSVSRISLLYR